jgi:hypothetical protein
MSIPQLTENMMRSTEAQAEARVKKTEIEAEIKVAELQVLKTCLAPGNP